MQNEQLKSIESSVSTVIRASDSNEQLHATGHYTVTCTDKEGNLKWEDSFPNLVTTQGKNYLLDKFLEGTSYTAAWYLGLVDGASSPTYNTADTGSSHSGWTENVDYSASTRPAPTWNAASSGSKATTPTTYNISGTATIAGCFLIDDDTKSALSGVLYSAGNFTGGSKSVASGDVLNVTYTASV